MFPRWLKRGLIVGIVVILASLAGLYAHVSQARASNDQQDSFFMNGVDASTLLAMEQHGAKYYDHGRQEDFLQILKNNGVNSVRLRLWVNPANDPQLQPAVDDLPATLLMVKRLKKAGLNFYLDLHYSDTWADPGHQTTPLAWANETPDQLVQTVYSYTKDVFSQLRRQGTLPQLVQIGNETNCGMLWPTGYNCSSDTSEQVNFANYINAGIKAVREQSPHTRIALHYAGNYPEWWLDRLQANGVTDYDVIALSYYIFWHGPLANLATEIPSLKAAYHKDVIIAEFAYPWTLQDFDGTSNSVSGPGEWTDLSMYPVTPAGQKQEIIDELSTIKNAGGVGAFYWEPGWYAVPGAGWIDSQGDGWENMTLVDQNGKTLPAMRAFLSGH